MPDWSAPQRPIDHAEESLVTAILDGDFTPGQALPGERDLASQLGVTRPTLREALRRLERDGWLTIQQGKHTRVNDFWREGGPNILAAMARYSDHLPPEFVTKLLEVRSVLAPAYIGAAVARRATEAEALVVQHEQLDDTAEAFARFDWHLHHGLSELSGNPVYTLILNGFSGFYEEVATVYFKPPEARQVSRDFYQLLQVAAREKNVILAEQASKDVMRKSIELWRATSDE